MFYWVCYSLGGWGGGGCVTVLLDVLLFWFVCKCFISKRSALVLYIIMLSNLSLLD